MTLWRYFSVPKFMTFNPKDLPFRASRDFGTARTAWANIRTKCNEHVVMFGKILTRQCRFYAFQRVRRAAQINSLYARLYNEKIFNGIVAGLLKRLVQKQKNSLGLMLSALLFSWAKDRVTDEEIKKSITEFDDVLHQKGHAVSSDSDSSDWEVVVCKENLLVWRKQVSYSYLYEYRVFGTFYDIPARTFFNVQTDTEYRKTWDKLVIQLDVVDKEESGSEVLYWVMHYPYPMYSRDYVYVRRAMVDAGKNVMVLVSRAVEHPVCPENAKYVRVKKYSSKMVIRPHSSFDENGFDYLLTYFDDPNAAFPSPAYNWMASTGVPDFVNKLHCAAQDLHKQSRSRPHMFVEDYVTSGVQPLPAYA